MYLQFFIAILAVSFITFGLGFFAGFQKGEESINVRLKYLLLKDENAMLKLAFKNVKQQLLRLKHGEPEPMYDDFEYGDTIGMESEETV